MHFSVILSGCGQYDGSETHETILTLLAMANHEISWDAFAPNIQQSQVINHIDASVEVNDRNVLVESSRLVRGRIKSIDKANADDYDAVIIPGGIGSVTNLCNWQTKGANCSFDSGFAEFMNKVKSLKKPTGFICIAPMMIPFLYKGATLTIGNDPVLSEQINSLGSIHVDCVASEIVVDENKKLVTTPANMVAKNILEVRQGIDKLVAELKRMAS